MVMVEIEVDDDGMSGVWKLSDGLNMVMSRGLDVMLLFREIGYGGFILVEDDGFGVVKIMIFDGRMIIEEEEDWCNNNNTVVCVLLLMSGAIYETTKNPSQDKISGPNNESSNSCLQPPPNKMPVSTIPETLEEDHSQETPVTEHASKGATLEEISTADSPPKGNPEENRQASPSIEANDQMKEDSPKGDNAAVNDDSTEKGRTDPTPNNEVKPQQQDPKPADNEGASNQKSPSPEPENMD
ncbi:hypothetical protein P8452_66886 [Trifolium repens]|nr:hypothetical protein P8452_66886 [Trifolium repens]